MRAFLSFIICSCLLATTYSAQAQTRFSVGPQVGLNASTVRYTDVPDLQGSPKSSYYSGLTAGLTASFNYKHFALQPSVLFAMKGFVLNDEYSDPPQSNFKNRYHEQYRFNYLAFPINVAYFQHKDGQGIEVFGGGYVAFLLSGKVQYDNSFEFPNGVDYFKAEKKVVAGSEFNQATGDFYTKYVDAGLQIGIGYQWHAILLQSTYHFGLVNLGAVYPNSPYAAPEYYNRQIALSAAYLFHKKNLH